MQNLYNIFVEALDGKEKDFVSGSINRAIVLLSIPMILEMAMESLFAVVDAFFVAKISVQAVAAVGMTESVITIIYSLAIGLSTAASAMVARRIGEGKPGKAAVAAMQSIYIATAISIIVGIFGLVYAEDVLRWLGGDDDMIRNCVGYTRIAFGSNIAIMLLFLLNGVFRGAGDAAIAMRSLWLANGINIVLDPILIFGFGPIPAFGIEGAAIATAIGRSVGVVYQLNILWKGTSIIHLTKEHLHFHWKTTVKLLKIAYTGALQFLIASASWIFLMRIIARFGDDAVAGYTISIRLLVFTILPSWGIANAAATLVGQNLGAKQPDRAEISVWRAAFYNMLFLATVSVIYFFSAGYLIRIFDDTPAVVEAGVLSLRIICAGYIFFAYGMVISQSLNGAGDTRTPTIINLICFWAMEIPLGYFLAITLDWELAGVCWAIAISETMAAVFCIWVFKRGKWKLIEI